MVQATLHNAAALAFRAVAQLRARAEEVITQTNPAVRDEVSSESASSTPGAQITDDANWLDLNREEQVAFDEKLANFLDLEIENRERDWLLSNSEQ